MQSNMFLRKQIVEMVHAGKDGHIPSAFSIVDIIAALYKKCLKFNPAEPDCEERDHFILSKGHGCLALYVVLKRHGFLTDTDMALFCKKGGILGEHPDRTKVPGAEASTGSLGHGLPFALGIALGLRQKGMSNRVIVLLGDGECQEGTVWEAANIANNLDLGNLSVIVDWNGSAAQLMPKDDLPAKWRAFGWNVEVIDGHSEEEIVLAVNKIPNCPKGTPTAIIARTTKGKGVKMLEGHGLWHHRIPNAEEYAQIMEALS